MMKSDGNCGKYRELLKDKKRIVVKIGSSSLQHPETGDLDYTKLDVLVRELCNMRNRTVAKGVFEAIFAEDRDPEQYVDEKGLRVVSDEGALKEVIEEILQKNPQSVEDYKAGKQKAMGFVVGQTMRAMKGKADPAVVNKLVRELLSR